MAGRKTILGLGVAVAVLLPGPTALASDPRFGPDDIRSLFAVAKNTNRNEVHYGIHLDASCMPVGDKPVHAYWRQFERGPDAIEDLNMLDRTVYSIREQRVVTRSAEESKVVMSLKATPERGIAVIVRKRDGKCVSETIAKINGTASLLDRIFVHIGLMSVDWVELRGRLDNQPVVEHVKR